MRSERVRSIVVSLASLFVMACEPATVVPDATPPPDGRPVDVAPGTCKVDEDCASLATCTDWEPCDYDGCAAVGIRGRTCTSYTCVNHVCEGSNRVETESCTRDPEGMECDLPVCVDGACTFDGDPACDESGTLQRTCTPRICQAGQCVDGVPTVTDEPCLRETDGVTCGADVCSDGPCVFEGDPTCDDTGTKDRTCTPRVCAAEVCTDGTPFTVQVSCTRDTAGAVCGGTTQIDGACQFEGNATCDETGQFTRTFLTPICAGGTCSGTSTSTTQIACTRETGGVTCAPTSCVDTSQCAFEGGECDETGTKTQSCTPFICGGDTCNAGSSYSQTVGCTRITDGLPCDRTSAGCPPGGVRDICCNTSGSCSEPCSLCQIP